MSFAGFYCEATHPEQPTVLSADCLACARQGALPGCALTAPVVKGILKGLRAEDFGLTVTTLLGCPRKWRLQQTEPYWLKPSEAWWAYRGQLMHGIAAEYARDDYNAIAERRFSLMVGDTEISGQPDLVLVDRRHLVDYKTTKSVPGPIRTWTCPETHRVIRQSQFAWRNKWMDCLHCATKRHEAKAIEALGEPRPYLRHLQQVSLYRLILWENGLEVDTAEIVYQDMRQQLRLPADMLSLADARTLLEARLRLHQQTKLPGILTDSNDVWECDFCPVRAACERVHGSPVGKVISHP